MSQHRLFLDENNNFNSQYTITEDSMHKGAVDHIDRAKQHLKNIQKQNQSLANQLNELNSEPKLFIKSIRDQIINKINRLRQDNATLKKMVGNSKLPTYSSIRKKQIINQTYMDESSHKSSMRQSLRNSVTARTVLSQIDSNLDKNQIASTCQNQQQKTVNPILKLKKPTPNQTIIRQKIQQQINLLLAKTQIFENQIKNINKRQIKESQKQSTLTEKEQYQLTKVQQYKKKLLRLLNKLKSRQCAAEQMVKAYRKLHEETIYRLKQASQTLHILQSQNVDDDIQQKYKQVMELEERLQIINAELDQMDQSKWIQSVLQQLLIICKRLGVKVSKKENIRELIDELSQHLIEHHLSSKKDNAIRLLIFKQYQDDQKKNNQKLLVAMKAKQQALGRKLMDLQMNPTK